MAALFIVSVHFASPLEDDPCMDLEDDPWMGIMPLQDGTGQANDSGRVVNQKSSGLFRLSVPRCAVECCLTYSACCCIEKKWMCALVGRAFCSIV